MKSPFFFLLVLVAALPVRLFAQSQQQGIVLEYNEKRQKTPLANVEIVVSNAGSTVSGSDGTFTLNFRTLKPGDKVQVTRISKPGYEVFNEESIGQWYIASDDQPFTIVLVRSERIQKIRNGYQKAATRATTRQYESDRKSLSLLLRDETITREEFDHRMLKLKTDYESRLDNIDNYVERFVRIDLSELDRNESRIIRLVSEGNLDAALKLYEQEDLVGKISIQNQQIKRLQSDVDYLSQVQNHQNITRDSLRASIQRQVSLLLLKGDADNNQKALSLLHQVAVADSINYDSWSDYAGLARKLRHYDEAQHAYEVMHALAESQGNLTQQASADVLRGILHVDRHQYTEARAILQNAIPQLESQSRLSHDSLSFTEPLADAYLRYAYAIAYTTGPVDAQPVALRAIQLYRDRRKSHPGSYTAELAIALTSVTQIIDRSNVQLSEDLLKEAQPLLHQLYQEKPLLYQGYYAYGQFLLGMIYFTKGPNYSLLCEQAFSSALELFRQAALTNPSTYALQAYLAAHNLADLYVMMEDDEQALRYYNESLEGFKPLYESDHELFFAEYHETISDLGSTLFRKERFSEALPFIEEQAEMLRPLFENDPHHFTEQYATALVHLANCYNALNRHADAYRTIQRALAVDPNFPETRRKVAEFRLKAEIQERSN